MKRNNYWHRGTQTLGAAAVVIAVCLVAPRPAEALLVTINAANVW